MNRNMFQRHFNKVINNWFNGINKRPFINTVLDKLSFEWHDKNIFIIEAPTGYGKTTVSATLSLFSLEEDLKTIVSYPLRTLLEDQYAKFKKLIHSDLLLGKRYMHNPHSPYLSKPVTLTTIDTLSLTLFGLAPEDLNKVVKFWTGTSGGSLGHFLFSWASVALSNLILDETHLLADSTKSLNFLLALMKIAILNDQKLVLMSATIPEALKIALKNNLIPIELEKLSFISFKEEFDKEFVKERSQKRYKIYLEGLDSDEKFSKLLEWLKSRAMDHDKIIIVFNTVSDAVEFYNLIKSSIDTHNIILLHSRFSEKDREIKINKLRKLISSGERYIIVSTQVIEAGVDVSSDLFITEIAPANSLIQRLGRFLRYNGESYGVIYIWYETKNNELRITHNRYKVYQATLVERVLDYLRNLRSLDSSKFNVHLPSSYRNFLNSVYMESDFEINMREVNSLIRLLFNLDVGSLRAINKFYELEGSFVREGTLIPVIDSSRINKHLKNNLVELTVRDLASLNIPLSFETLRRMNILNAIVRVKDRETGETKLVLHDINITPKSAKELIRYMYKYNVLSFIVDASYDNEFGLIPR